MTSTAGELTPETVELATDVELQDSDGQESRRSRSQRGSVILETPRHPKRKYAVVPAPIVPVTVPKVQYPQNYPVRSFIITEGQSPHEPSDTNQYTSEYLLF